VPEQKPSPADPALCFVALLGIALMACKKEAADATPADSARALAACRALPDFEPSEAEALQQKLDTHCASAECSTKKKISRLCYFYGPRTQGHYRVFTTVSGGDVATRDDTCDMLRASGVFASISPIYLHCADGKACSTCGGGGHR
jgi:hypothetical protein